MLIDAHTHTQFAAFKGDYKEVIRRALKAGVSIINVGTQRDTSRRAVEVAHEFEEGLPAEASAKAGVYATVGLHPIHTEKSYHDVQELGSPSTGSGQTLKGLEGFASRGEEFDYDYYKKLAQDPKVVAIGECGLDYYRLGISDQGLGARNLQRKVFLEQVTLAKELNKTLMIHCRPSKGTDDAYEDLLPLITNYQLLITKVVHFYVGSLAITKKLVEAGFYFTFGGVITFARDYDEVIKYIPLDRILTETDAPYVAPEPYRGKRNEPAYVIEVVEKLAEIKSVSYDKIVEATAENARKVFRL